MPIVTNQTCKTIIVLFRLYLDMWTSLPRGVVIGKMPATRSGNGNRSLVARLNESAGVGKLVNSQLSLDKYFRSASLLQRQVMFFKFSLIFGAKRHNIFFSSCRQSSIAYNKTMSNSTSCFCDSSGTSCCTWKTLELRVSQLLMSWDTCFILTAITWSSLCSLVVETIPNHQSFLVDNSTYQRLRKVGF